MMNTWWGDIQAQTAYCYDFSHDIGEERFKMRDLHPYDDQNKVPVEIKFIKHESQSLNKDNVTFWLQFKPGAECELDYYDSVLGKKYGATWPVGTYWDIQAEDGKYNKWLCVALANYWQNQFPTYQILPVDHLLQWIHNGKKYECPCVLASQNSQIMRFIGETLCRKFSNCWKDSSRVNQQRSQFLLKRSTSKVRQVPENGNHLSHFDMVLICSKLIGDSEKIYFKLG